MALDAFDPLFLVGSGIDGKPQAVVIEGGVVPTGGLVAAPALGSEHGRHMVGVGGGQVIVLVAGEAIGAQSAEIAAVMTFAAIEGTVSTVQGEAGGGVVEIGPAPGRAAVAQRAVLVEVPHHVVGALGGEILGRVAEPTLRRRVHVDQLAAGAARVASLAVEGDVASREWEAGDPMQTKLIGSVDETPLAVAALAVEPQLAQVDVAVAAVAVPRHLPEFERVVAEAAFELSVSSSQRQTEVAVVELGLDLRRLPPLRTVAEAAVGLELTVGMARSITVTSRFLRRQRVRRQNPREAQHEDEPGDSRSGDAHLSSPRISARAGSPRR